MDFVTHFAEMMEPSEERFSFKVAVGVNDILSGRQPLWAMAHLRDLREIIRERFPNSLVAFGEVAMVMVERFRDRARFDRSTSYYNQEIHDLNGRRSCYK